MVRKKIIFGSKQAVTFRKGAYYYVIFIVFIIINL